MCKRMSNRQCDAWIFCMCVCMWTVHTHIYRHLNARAHEHTHVHPRAIHCERGRAERHGHTHTHRESVLPKLEILFMCTQPATTTIAWLPMPAMCAFSPSPCMYVCVRVFQSFSMCNLSLYYGEELWAVWVVYLPSNARSRSWLRSSSSSRNSITKAFFFLCWTWTFVVYIS